MSLAQAILRVLPRPLCDKPCCDPARFVPAWVSTRVRTPSQTFIHLSVINPLLVAGLERRFLSSNPLVQSSRVLFRVRACMGGWCRRLPMRQGRAIRYYHYQAPATNRKRRPLVFMHGIGIGNVPYTTFLRRLLFEFPRRSIVLVRICIAPWLNLCVRMSNLWPIVSNQGRRAFTHGPTHRSDTGTSRQKSLRRTTLTRYLRKRWRICSRENLSTCCWLTGARLVHSCSSLLPRRTQAGAIQVQSIWFRCTRRLMCANMHGIQVVTCIMYVCMYVWMDGCWH